MNQGEVNLHIINPATWMADLPEALTTRSLHTLAIPGSHDSFSFALSQDGGIAVNESPIVKLLGTCCCKLGKCVIHKWSQTQSLDFIQQLEAGVRYFDLRICCKPGTTDICFIHGLYGQNVEDGFRAMNNFLDGHNKEVLILDFNHFYNMQDVDHERILVSLQGTFGERLIRTNITLQGLTLQNLWAKPHRVIVFYHARRQNQPSFVWPSNMISSPWPRCTTVRDLLAFLDRKFTDANNEHFHVWQGVLTPTTCTIVCNLCSSLKKTLAEKATPAFLNWTQGKFGINICIVDFVELSDYVAGIIRLNYENLE